MCNCNKIEMNFEGNDGNYNENTIYKSQKKKNLHLCTYNDKKVKNFIRLSNHI